MTCRTEENAPDVRARCDSDPYIVTTDYLRFHDFDSEKNSIGETKITSSKQVNQLNISERTDRLYLAPSSPALRSKTRNQASIAFWFCYDSFLFLCFSSVDNGCSGMPTNISESSCLGFGSLGIAMVNVEPFPTTLSAEIVPPWASTMRLQIESPRPIPWGLVVKRGNQIFVMTSFGIPAPVSEKLTATLSFTLVLFTVSTPPLGIASKAFSTILEKAVLIFSRSHFILGVS